MRKTPWRSDTFTNVAGFSCFSFNSSEIKPGPKIERSFYGVQANLEKSYFGAKIPTGIYLLIQSNNRNTRTVFEICSKLTIKRPEQRQ